jgi:hypothetical protein
MIIKIAYRPMESISLIFDVTNADEGLQIEIHAWHLWFLAHLTYVFKVISKRR